MSETSGPAAAAAPGAGPRSGALVTLDHVGKTFANRVEALRDLSFSVGEGTFVSLLGPSGCGKSTILRLIAGLIGPSRGTVAFADQAGASRPRAGIGFVFQEPTLMPWATVFDNVRLPLRLTGGGRTGADRRRVEGMLEQVGLAGFGRAYPRELSGGMKMRVSIARALVTQPRLLLMDEPFAALDEITRFRLNDDLLALWLAQRWTVVFVTHSVFESAYLSQRILVMSPRPGRIVADIAVAAPYPRDEAFRTTPPYNEICRRISSALHAATGEEAPA